jgi:hypothetical protein
MEIMRVHEIRNIIMDLIRDGKHPDEETGKELKLGDGAGINMLEKTADFTIVDEASEQKFEVFIKPLPRSSYENGA